MHEKRKYTTVEMVNFFCLNLTLCNITFIYVCIDDNDCQVVDMCKGMFGTPCGLKV